MKTISFSAKLLLFGEYAIMENAKGLSIPYNLYRGVLRVDSYFKTSSNLSRETLKKYADFLEELQNLDDFSADLDLSSIRTDLKKGMYFDSNIPQGYGVGSSGALVAAIYASYVRNNHILSDKVIKNEHILVLKKIFSMMESYFHGKSSGIDPLICYLNLPLLIHSANDISIVSIPKSKKKTGVIFLINSGIPRNTSSMIEVFFKKLKSRSFKRIFFEEFIKYNDTCIEDFLNGSFQSFIKNIKLLSEWVLKNLHPMIPSSLFELWGEGIHENTYYLKLCGSGGGGFVFGFSTDYELVKEKFRNYYPEVIFQF